ncbi:MAG: response regulator transcription factor [Vicinamibacterales bacterium]
MIVTAPIRVLCVDDHRLVREGLALILAREGDIEVVGAAATGEEALELFCRTRPDVTLMDLQLGTTSGVDAIRAIRREDPGARVIVVTMYHGDEDIYRAMQAGAATYVVKDTLADDLLRVVREVYSGLRPVSDDVRETLRQRALQPTLTSREIEVLGLIAQGLRNREVGVTLRISEETVRVHVKNVFHKLDVTDRTEAVRVAVRRGIIHLS